MKVPISWLREYVDFEADVKTLAKRLTFAGIEVESIELKGAVPNDIIIGEITEVEPHMHANHLHICRVNNGTEVLRVVSGAGNCKVGARVPLAVEGVTLPNGITVKSQKIRDELSLGILCAEDELGLSEDHSGLMILPPEVKIGRPLIEFLGPADYVLSLEITPNRPDLLGIIGIAREVAALFGTKIKWPVFDLREEEGSVQDVFSVTVENNTDCPRYTARLMHNVVVKQSPFWLRRKLVLAGFKPINNIVDITNFVLQEYGQPLHAFDFNLLAEKKIIVRRAKDGEKITALDGLEYKLKPQMLVIADGLQAAAIAGVMGGEKSSIQPGTSSILLESACFQPSLIRQTSKTLGLASESSYRFERGVDINQVDFASRRACALMAQIASARLAKGVIDIFGSPPAERKITCRYNRVSSLLGIDIPTDRIKSIFNSLDLPVCNELDNQCAVSIKSFRNDLETEVDLIEEIARIHGLDQIPSTDPRCHMIASANDKPVRAQMHCRQLMAALGLREIVNYSFVSEKLLDVFDAASTKNRIKIPRPVSADHTILRDSLLPQMAETLGRNRSRQLEEAAFFELARVFARTSASPFHEETRIAVGLMGAMKRNPLQKRQALTETEIFSWLKGILNNFHEKLMQKEGLPNPRDNNSAKGLSLNDISSQPLPGFYAACFKPNRCTLITLFGKPCGIMGLLKDEIRREWRIVDPVGLMEFMLDPFLKDAFQTPQASTLPMYPSITRDIAMRVPFSIHHADIIKTIWKNAPKELTSLVLFDIYISKALGKGFKSMAYSLTYRSLERTLTDEEVNKLHESVKKQLKKELMVEMREG